MVELADIFRRYVPGYIDRFGHRMLPSHRRAIDDIIACRTEQMGGHLYCCENPDCEQLVYAYHSCGNRSCPKCGQDKTQRWLERQHQLLLPTHYFLVTFTLPGQLRPIARSNQKLVYNLLFKSSAEALKKLAKDPRFVGGDIGMMAGLHTWQRDLGYHPHVHFIVPARQPLATIPMSTLSCRQGHCRLIAANGCLAGLIFWSRFKRCHLSFEPSSVMDSKKPTFSVLWNPVSGKKTGWCTANRWAAVPVR